MGRPHPVRVRLQQTTHAVAVLDRDFPAVLEVLLAAGGAAVGAEELLARGRNTHADPLIHGLRVAVMCLRQKLGPRPPLGTVVGRGYRVKG